MKLVFVNRFFHPDHSATSQILSDLAFHVAATGAGEVVVVTSRQRYDDASARLPPSETLDGVRVVRVWTTRFGRAGLLGRALDYLSFYVSAAIRLWSVSRKGDVIVAKTDPPLIGVVAWMVARARRATLVNWIQDAFPEVAQAIGVRVPFFGALRGLRNASMRAAAVNVVLGERMAEWARGEGMPEARLAVIPNWADEAAIRPSVSCDNPLRQEWGVDRSFVVAYSGNLGRAHDYRTALAAAELLRAETDIVFLFIGGGHHRDDVMAEARARRLASIRWIPYQPRERLTESLGVGDVHWLSLLPELEGLMVPSKIYGILAAGRPALMVGDADSEIGRLLAREDCGWTVRPGDGTEFAAAIRRLRDEPELRGAMGNRARQAAEGACAMAAGLKAWKGVIAGVAK